MNRSSLRSLVLTLSLAFAVPLVAMAQDPDKVKPPRRLPPNASEASRIPAGVDTGSPATSDAQQLGTPVPPNAGADRTELKTRSAAARAAARPRSIASSPDCTKKLGPAAGASASLSTGASSAASRGLTRIDC
jgi:hypothetical protein